MKIAIVGYGRMGHEIESIARSKGYEIVTIDPSGKAQYREPNAESLKGVDIAIDFTVPESALKNAKVYNQSRVNCVMGTTGWYGEMEQMRGSVQDIGFIWSGNFSIGVNVFFRIIANASKIMDKIDSYDALAYELHHKGKADSPSGTAKMIGDIILQNMQRKNNMVAEKLDRKINSDELHFASVRGGSIPGTHTVIFDSEADQIELTHRVKSRVGLASGAMMAAEWINGKKGFFGIDDLMNGIIGK